MIAWQKMTRAEMVVYFERELDRAWKAERAASLRATASYTEAQETKAKLDEALALPPQEEDRADSLFDMIALVEELLHPAQMTGDQFERVRRANLYAVKAE